MADTFAKASISSEAARRLITAAEAKAAELGKPFVTAVVDDGGVLKALSRMDGAPLLSVQVAQDKAYTAVGFALPTHGWHDFIKDDPPLAAGAPSGIDRLVVFGGGYPHRRRRSARGRDRRERGPLQRGHEGGRGGAGRARLT